MAWDGVTDEVVLTTFVEARAGDRQRDDAFHELVDRFEQRVYSTCYRYFGNHADAQDATQEAFVAIMRNAASFRGGSRLSTWIYRVAVNACNDLARKRARRPQLAADDGSTAAVEQADPEDAYAARETELAVQQALLQLDDLSRTLVVLVAIQGLGYQEVAEAVDLPVGTVKSRVHRARARLAELLTTDDDGPVGTQPGGPSGPLNLRTTEER